MTEDEGGIDGGVIVIESSPAPAESKSMAEINAFGNTVQTSD